MYNKNISLYFFRFLLLLILTVGGGRLEAQVFYPATLVLQSGEQLSGEAAVRSFDKNIDRVQFRGAPEQPIRTYPALEIDRLTIAGKSYRGGVVQLERSPRRYDYLRQQADWQFTQDTLLLETVLSGDRALYRVRLIGALDLYYIPNAAGGYELLRYKRYLKTSRNELSIVRERRDFVLQLSQYLNDCPEVRAALQGLKYEEAAIKKLYAAHGRCAGTEISAVDEMAGGKIKTRVTAGVAFSHLSVYAINRATQRAYRGTPLPRPTVGLGFDYVPKQGRSNWMASGDLVYTSVGHQPTQVGNRTKDLNPINIGYFEVMLTGRARSPVNEHTYVLTGLGLVLGRRLHEEVEGLSYTYEDGSGFTRTRVLESNMGEFGAIFQVGLQYKRTQLQAFTAVLSPHLTTGHTIRFGLTAGYYFSGY